MKTCLVIVLLISCVTSCKQAESMSADLLYRRWRLFRTQHASSGQSADTPSAEWTVTEFRPNGTIVYGTNGRYTACCSPSRFRRIGTTLDLVNVASIPIPETDNPGSCASVNCITPGDTWQIVTLSSQLLIIETSYGLNFYQPY